MLPDTDQHSTVVHRKLGELMTSYSYNTMGMSPYRFALFSTGCYVVLWIILIAAVSSHAHGPVTVIGVGAICVIMLSTFRLGSLWLVYSTVDVDLDKVVFSGVKGKREILTTDLVRIRRAPVTGGFSVRRNPGLLTGNFACFELQDGSTCRLMVESLTRFAPVLFELNARRPDLEIDEDWRDSVATSELPERKEAVQVEVPHDQEAPSPEQEFINHVRDAQFPLGLKGYAVNEVDAWLQSAVTELTAKKNGQSVSVPDSPQFKKILKGYQMKEVDELVTQILEQFNQW